jgi:hypothetical protein
MPPAVVKGPQEAHLHVAGAGEGRCHRICGLAAQLQGGDPHFSETSAVRHEPVAPAVLLFTPLALTGSFWPWLGGKLRLRPDTWARFQATFCRCPFCRCKRLRRPQQILQRLRWRAGKWPQSQRRRLSGQPDQRRCGRGRSSLSQCIPCQRGASVGEPRHPAEIRLGHGARGAQRIGLGKKTKAPG